MNPSLVVWTAVLSSVVSFSVSYAMFDHRVEKLETALEELHPIVFLDPADLAIQMLPMGSGDSEIEQFNDRVSTLVKAYVDNGFIVLPKGDALGLPIGTVVSPEELPKQPTAQAQGE